MTQKNFLIRAVHMPKNQSCIPLFLLTQVLEFRVRILATMCFFKSIVATIRKQTLKVNTHLLY